MLRHYRHSASGTRSAAAATTQPAAASGDAAAVSAEDYARAEAFTAEGVGGLVSSGGLMSFTGRGGIGIGASWLPDETLWYRDGDGAVVLVDPAAKTTAVCDDATCADLGIPAAASGGAAATAGASGGPPLTLSPDGLLGAFVQECNLWVRDIGTGIDRQLTFDGEKVAKDTRLFLRHFILKLIILPRQARDKTEGKHSQREAFCCRTLAMRRTTRDGSTPTGCEKRHFLHHLFI
jgi:hypothetical protein